MMEDLTQGKEKITIPGPKDANCFQYVKTNIPGPCFDTSQFMEEFDGCPCVDNYCGAQTCPCVQIFGPAYEDNGLLLESWCEEGNGHNRSILECGDNCNCKNDLCSLRVVQQGIKSRLRVFETSTKGFGLVSVDGIKKRSFVCEYAGEVLGENEAKTRLNKNQCFGLTNFLIAVKECTNLSENCLYVDPCQIGNIGRFINHSCDPNLIMIPVRVSHPVPRLALFARRDICAGEELTFDYSGVTMFNESTVNQMCSVSQPEQDVIQSCSCSKSDISTTNLSQVKENDACSCGNGDFEHNKSNFVVNDEVKEQSEKYANKRTKCFCGSKICHGYLPYDEYLFVENN